MSDKQSTFLKVAQYQHQGNKILKLQESLLPERGDMWFLFFDTPLPSGAQRMTKTERMEYLYTKTVSNTALNCERQKQCQSC